MMKWHNNKLPHGGIYAYNQNVTMPAVADVGVANKVQVTGSSGAVTVFEANESSNKMSPDHTEGHVLIQVTGTYLCTVSITINSLAGSAAKFGFGVFKNNGATQFTNLHVHRNLPASAGGNAGSLSMSGVVDLIAGDTVEVWYWNETNTQQLSVDDITLSLEMAGSMI